MNDDVLCRVRVFLYAYIFGWRADYPILFLDFHEKLIVKITCIYTNCVYIAKKNAENWVEKLRGENLNISFFTFKRHKFFMLFFSCRLEIMRGKFRCTFFRFFPNCRNWFCIFFRGDQENSRNRKLYNTISLYNNFFYRTTSTEHFIITFQFIQSMKIFSQFSLHILTHAQRVSMYIYIIQQCARYNYGKRKFTFIWINMFIFAKEIKRKISCENIYIFIFTRSVWKIWFFRTHEITM